MNESPLTDEELRVNGELQALAAELDRVVDGRNPNREAARDLARRYRALHTSLPDHSALKAGVGLAMVSAAERVTRALGTSAWDEPETVEELKARMAELPAAPASEPPPLTAEDLTVAESDLISGTGHEKQFAGLRLLAEVRRLRSDEWLKAAAEEIARWHEWTESEIGDRIAATEEEIASWPSGGDVQGRVYGRPYSDEDGRADSANTALAILRKHRDGKA